MVSCFFAALRPLLVILSGVFAAPRCDGAVHSIPEYAPPRGDFPSIFDKTDSDAKDFAAVIIKKNFNQTYPALDRCK